MSQENVEIVRRVVRSVQPAATSAHDSEFRSRDRVATRSACRRKRPIYRGLDAVSSGSLRLGKLGRCSGRAKPVLELEDSVVVAGARPTAGRASHVELDQEFAIVFTMGGGQGGPNSGLPGWHEALEAAGLSE